MTTKIVQNLRHGLRTASTRTWLVKLSLAASVASLLTGCGKESFQTISTVTTAEAPGYFTLAPKVDIVLAQDNTGSMSEIYTQMGAEVPRFLSNLSKTGWDYHFVSVPLTTTTNSSERLFTQVVASKHDRNWGEVEWQIPYPGALFSNLEMGTVSSNFFRRPSDYSDYGNYLKPTNSLTGVEPGMENIRNQLVNHMSDTGFHRDDAMLVILVVGNGDDTSGRKICRRNDGYEAPCDAASMAGSTPIRCGTPGLTLANNCRLSDTFTTAVAGAGTKEYSREYYKQALQSLRPSSSQVRLHAAVSNGGYCYGSYASEGAQYKSMASALGGSSHDICANSASTVLSNVQNALEIQRITLRTVYLTMEHEPDTSTIEVIRYVGGDVTRKEVIPQSESNGWSYAGYIQDQPSIVTDGSNPVTMNRATGWAVRLNGSARLSGNDTAHINFKPKGGS